MTIQQIETAQDEQLIPYEDNDDPNLRAHIVNPPANLHIFQPGMDAQDIVDIARANNMIVVALCGHEFIPKHNPDKYDACKTCIDIAGEIMRGLGE